MCGRKKDLIIFRGRNLCPEDIEAVAESVAEVRKGRTVAFGVADERTGTERVVLVRELVGCSATTAPAVLKIQLRDRIWQQLDVSVSEVALVPRNWVIKTTSGKVARRANREKFLAGEGV